MEKVCTKCKNPRNPKSTSSYCKECTRKSMAVLRAKPPHKYRELCKIQPDTDMSLEDFIAIIQMQCFYCGDVNDTLGLDRITPGSKNGKYVKDNVVSCCKNCNYMKGSLSSEDFRKFVDKIYTNLQSKMQIIL